MGIEGELGKLVSEAGEIGKIEKPGSGFDGPLNEDGIIENKDTTGLGEKPGSGFDGPSDEVEEKSVNNGTGESSRRADHLDREGTENVNPESKGLTEEEKIKIKEESGWSDEIVDHIRSMEEYGIYKDAGLKEEIINGKPALMREIDWDQKDENGLTNRERMEKGLCPLSKDGQYIELHHIGQKSDSPLAELTSQEHRGRGNDGILHDKSKQSEINRDEFIQEKQSHWKARAEG